MEWLDCMKNAIEFIEAHIEDRLDIKQVARIAASSVFHFQRMFSMLTDITVADYIRKRRLTLAAQELAANKSRVINIAMKYGYETPESFAKAFKKLHGITPSQARLPGAQLVAFPKISFHISIRGGRDMDYRIEQKQAFEVAGAIRSISTKDGANFKEVPAFWEDAAKDGTCEKVCAMAAGGNMYGICMDFEEDMSRFNYMIAADAPEGELPAGMVKRQMPAATWAVFTSVGPLPEAIQKVTQSIFSEWFPSTGYEHGNAPEIEVYFPGDTSCADYRCEVWIPVKKK